jgi:hypothetical protein
VFSRVFGVRGDRELTSSQLSQARSPVDISRRQILQGVSATAAMSALITVPAAPSLASNSNAVAEDILWLIGSIESGGRYALQAIAPDASGVDAKTNTAHSVIRSGDGRSIIEADFVGGVTQLRVFDAASGRLQSTGKGAISWPAEPDLSLAGDSTNQSVCVNGTCLITTPGPTLEKDSPDGGKRAVSTSSWQRVQGLEYFDMNAVLIDHSGPQEVPIGASSEFACVEGQALIVQHHDGGTVITAAANRRHTQRTSSHPTVQANLAHVDNAGRACLLTSDSNLLVRDPNGNERTIVLGLDSTQRRAKPVAPRVASISTDSVIIVDPSRQYLASVDITSNKITAERVINTHPSVSSLTNPMGQSLAVDVLRRRVYLLDQSGVTGGVWIYDADNLSVIDRWHSGLAFGLVWVSPQSGAVFLQTLEGPVAVHDASGSLISFVPSSLNSAKAL